MIRIRVIGTPAPQGSKRHVGKGIMVESSKKVRPWREAVANAAVDQVPESLRGMDGPLTLLVTFVMPRLGDSASRKRVAMGPIGPPDLSKLVRSTEDALTTAGIWRDDARVVWTLAEKRYAFPGEPTGAYICIDRKDVHPAVNREITDDEDAQAVAADLEMHSRREDRLL